MELYSENQTYKLFQGNMLDLGEVIEPCSIDSIVTDPPYELNFMGKGWDNSGIAFQPDTWKRCLEALKPGGYLLAFGGSRTYHRIACAIEDAGFEIRDCIMWLYGSGFPKSMNIGLAIDKKNGLQGQRGVGGFNVGGKGEQENRKAKLHIGSTTDGSKQPGYSDYKSDLAKQRAGWGTALKPSYEPIIVARKPLEGSCTDNVIKYGVGGINIDECRVGFDSEEDIKNYENNNDANLRTTKSEGENLGAYEGGWKVQKDKREVPQGRFPANTILTYGDEDKEEVCSGFHNDEQRYYYTAKASKRDRDEGLEEFEEKGAKELLNREENSDGASWNGKYSSGNAFAGSGAPKKNIHPTVKPTDLMQYLVRLVTPNGGTVLDPFNGSGSTGKAVMYENKDRNKNYKYIGIELTEEYLPIAKARIEYVINNGIEKGKEEEKAEGFQEQPLFF